MLKCVRPPIPESTKRIVRQDGFFGCVICGSPLIEYCHIVPYFKSHNNNPENLVPLCPTHHTKYDNEAISERRIREFKAKPFNKSRDVKDTFYIEGDRPIIEAGSCIFENTSIPLVIDDRNIISFYKENEELLFNALFYDVHNNLLAFIKDNEWCALSGMVWDIDYHTVAKSLVIRTKPRDILLRLRISSNIIHLSGVLYYNGLRAKILPSRIVFGDKTLTWQRVGFRNCVTAVAFNTQTGGFEIASLKHEHEYRKPILASLKRDTSQGRIYETVFIMKECKYCGQIVV